MANISPAEHSHGIDLESALDFLNTLHPGHGRTDEQHQRDEHLASPADAAMWFLEHELVHPDAGIRISETDLARIRRVRSALREVVDAVVEGRKPEPDAVYLVNATLEMRRPTRLELDGSALRIGHRHADTPVDDALALIAEAIIEELATGRPERMRVCANDRCRWAFFDSSPTGRRRWCDMRSCGNQAKAARYRARLKEESRADETPSPPELARGASCRTDRGPHTRDRRPASADRTLMWRIFLPVPSMRPSGFGRSAPSASWRFTQPPCGIRAKSRSRIFIDRPKASSPLPGSYWTTTSGSSARMMASSARAAAWTSGVCEARFSSQVANFSIEGALSPRGRRG